MKRIVSLIAAFMIFVIALSSCAEPAGGNEARAETAKRNAQDPANVEVMTVAPKQVTTSLTVTGETAPIKEVTYSAEASGSLDYIVPLGSVVHTGDILARVDYETLKARADQARASYGLAWKTYDRFRSLRKEDLVSQQQLDEAYSQMVQARSHKTIAETNLRNSQTEARFNSVVVQRYMEEGEYVVTGSPLVRAIDITRINVEAQVPERQVSRIAPRSPSKVHISALDREYDGVIDLIIPDSDARAKTFLLRVVIDNPEMEIMAGMAARISIETDSLERAIVVPQETVLEKESGKAVFVEKDGKARERKVITELTHEGEVIIRAGLSAGDNLIVTGHRELENDQPVRIVSN